jgi:hypothetical protein
MKTRGIYGKRLEVWIKEEEKITCTRGNDD